MTAPTPAGQARADRGEADLIERVAVVIAAEDGYDLGELRARQDPKRWDYERFAAAAVEVLRGEGR